MHNMLDVLGVWPVLGGGKVMCNLIIHSCVLVNIHANVNNNNA